MIHPLCHTSFSSAACASLTAKLLSIADLCFPPLNTWSSVNPQITSRSPMHRVARTACCSHSALRLKPQSQRPTLPSACQRQVSASSEPSGLPSVYRSCLASHVGCSRSPGRTSARQTSAYAARRKTAAFEARSILSNISSCLSGRKLAKQDKHGCTSCFHRRTEQCRGKAAL